MVEAERQFRRAIRHGELAKLAVTVERDIAVTATDHRRLRSPRLSP